MVREVLTINIGQCGVQLGRRIWEQYNTEHGITAQGAIYMDRDASNKKKHTNDTEFLAFYEETESGCYLPRNLVVDLDPDTIQWDLQRIRANTPFLQEFHVHGEEDAANIFARGMYSVGPKIIDQVDDALRRLVDKCGNVQGFVINHAVGGGTGSGLGSLILEHLAVNYRKKSKLGVEVYPFNNHLSQCVVEPYNALLATHWLLDHTELSLLFDNRKVYNLCQSKLEINQPTYNDMNSLIAKIITSQTRSLRYEGELNVDLNEYGRLIVFPRLHFLVTSLAPLVNNMEIEHVLIAPKYSKVLVDGFVRYYYPFLTPSANDSLQFEPPLYGELMDLIYKSYSDRYRHYSKKYYDINCIDDLFEMCCDPDYFMVECEDFDVDQDKCIFATMNCAGTLQIKELNGAAHHLKRNKNIAFVPWAPGGIKLGLNQHEIPRIDDDDKIAPRKKVITMITDNTCMSRFFMNRICKKTDKMYSQRAYVHWYVAGGMEEGEFAEAREDLGFLEKDYLDILSEEDTDQQGTRMI
eukprot:1058631_1